ncbi:hypothetical protein ACHQM5_010038 [Ranunculus cassubicifolius]
MPPESLPWDRIRDNKKHDRSDTLRSVARWRDSHHAAFNRGNHDFRRPQPQGHGKQGLGYQLFSEGGFMPFRPSSDRMVSDDNGFRSSPIASARGSGYVKYARNGREIRGGSFSHKGGGGGGGYVWDSTDTSSLARDITTQRSVSDLITYASPDIDNSSWDHLHFKDHYDKHLLPTGHRYDSALDWKPLKWNRSSSLSSRGSAFSHTSSSRADSDETKPEFPSRRPTPAHSPSAAGYRGASLLSNGSYEETYPRKKQRLGWGQGLAKYEKQKVEGSDETFCRNTLIPCATNAKSSQTVPCLSDKSPRLTGPSECPSPVTTSSVACSSSPGIDDKPPSMTENNDIGTCNLSDSPTHGFQSCLDEFSASLDHLNCANNLSNLLNDLLQIEDASSGDSNFVKSTAMHKLLLVKSELSKALEKTECEIDLFENELKALNTELKSDGLQEECTKSCENVDTLSKMSQKSVPLQLVPSSDMHVEIPDFCNVEEVHEEVKDVDIDSPGTATSKFAGPLCMEKTESTFGPGKYFGCSPNTVAARSDSSEQPCILSSVTKEKTAIVSADSKFEGSIDARGLIDLSSGSNFSDVILVSNKNSAREAFELFSKLLPDTRSEVDIWESCNITCQTNNSHVKEKLALRKNSQRFKERALTLKFRALHHLWKEDMRLLSAKKYKAKSQKRVELNPRPSHIVHQKHRSSIRSRFISPGSLALAPTSEIVDLTSKLLSDSQIKVCRDNLKMPCLVDEKEKRMLRFVSSNGLVEDPCATEMERVMVNPWMANEKEVFLEKLATFGKDFKKIASFLDHKTTADCVEFYYKNHKSEFFEKIKKKSELKKQERAGFPTNTYMMTSGNKWNREVNTASLVLLGEASVIAADADCGSKSEYTSYMSRPSLGGNYYRKTCWEDDISIDKSSSLDAGVEDEREATAADMLAGLSSEAMSSCVTSCVEPAESCQFQKSVKPMDDDDDDDEETCSDESSGELDSVDWTDEEKLNFIDAVRCYGKDFVKIARRVRSRSRDQCKVFFSKARKSLGLDVINVGKGTTLSDASGGGGGSDTEDALVFEAESVICSTLSSKLDAASANCQALAAAATTASKQLYPDEHRESIGRMEQSTNKYMCTDDDFVPERSGESSGGLQQPLNAAKVSDMDKSLFFCEEEVDDSKEAVDATLSSDLDTGTCSTEEGVVKQEKTSAVDENCMVDDSGQVFKTESQIMLPEGGCGGEDDNSNLGSRSESGDKKNFACYAMCQSLVTTFNPHQQELMHPVSVNDKEKTANSLLLIQNDGNPGQGLSSLGLKESKFEEQERMKETSHHHQQQQVDCSQIPRGYPQIDGLINKKEVSTSRDHLKSVPRSYCQESDECRQRVGDVKLFGQILSHPSSSQQQKQEMTSTSHHPKSSSSTNMYDLKLKTPTSSSSSSSSRCEPPPVVLLNDFPARSYGFWDRSRIQTRLSSLPDPSILLAKYPPPAAAAAVALSSRDYSSCVDERTLSCISSIYPLLGPTPSSSNSSLMVPDYHHVHVYKGEQQLRHEGLLFSDIQQQQQQMNGPGGLEVVSSYQQSRGIGTAVSGVGISDPVAAIKMHYATTTMENDPWRGVGDLGR